MVKGFKVAVATAVIAVSGFAGTAIVTAVPAHAQIKGPNCSFERIQMAQRDVKRTEQKIATLQRKLQSAKGKWQKQAHMREIAKLSNQRSANVALLDACRLAYSKTDERVLRRLKER